MARLIVINQTVNPAFNGWLRQLAAAVGPLALWCGNPPPAGLGPDITIHPAPAYQRASAFSRLRTWGWFTLVVAGRLLRQGGQTPLFVVTNPPFAPLLAGLLRRWQQRPFALLEWDIYPQILAPMGLAGPRHPLYRLWFQAHAHALRRASLVITLGEEMAGVLRAMVGDAPLPLAVIPNWADTEWLRPLPRPENPFFQAQGWPAEDLLVLYSGNLGATHAIETILAVAERLRTRPGIRFVLIGEGSKRALVEAAIATGRLPNLHLLPYQPLDQLPYTLPAADVGIVTLGDGYEGLSMPSKTYDLLAAGNAILGISRAPNDLAATLASHRLGANFAPDDPAGIAAWLETLAGDRAQLAAMQQAARQAAEQQYSAAICPARLTAAVRQHLLAT